jgi:hypothetical protein
MFGHHVAISKSESNMISEKPIKECKFEKNAFGKYV